MAGRIMKKIPRERIKARRLREGASLRTFAEKCGMSYSNLHAIEEGKQKITASSAMKIGRYTGMAWTSLCTE